MAEILDIIYVEKRVDKDGNTYYRTHAILTDGDEVVGFGNNYFRGESVERFFHYGQGKMQKKKAPSNEGLQSI